MTSNILFLPFRKTHSLAISAAIKQYISSKYDQHPDMFKQDLDVVDNLRRDAVFVREPHVSGLKKIAAYAAQLVWMGGKFPIDVGSPAPRACPRACPSKARYAYTNSIATDWRGLHVVPGPGLQHRTADIPEQPQVRAVQHPLQPRGALFPTSRLRQPQLARRAKVCRELLLSRRRRDLTYEGQSRARAADGTG